MELFSLVSQRPNVNTHCAVVKLEVLLLLFGLVATTARRVDGAATKEEDTKEDDDDDDDDDDDATEEDTKEEDDDDDAIGSVLPVTDDASIWNKNTTNTDTTICVIHCRCIIIVVAAVVVWRSELQRPHHIRHMVVYVYMCDFSRKYIDQFGWSKEKDEQTNDGG
jgi:hypothetical protein